MVHGQLDVSVRFTETAYRGELHLVTDWSTLRFILELALERCDGLSVEVVKEWA